MRRPRWGSAGNRWRNAPHDGVAVFYPTRCARERCATMNEGMPMVRVVINVFPGALGSAGRGARPLACGR
jgi:hypothetical protein